MNPNNINLMSKKSTLKSGTCKISKNYTPYVLKVEKLQSIGPLQITDLEEFLAKAKIDFKNLYHSNGMEDLKITDFTIIKKLGAGAFGKVILTKLKKDGSVYAVKVLDKKEVVKGKQIRLVNNEKRILQSINFPFVVYLKYFFADFNYLYFALPFVPGGDLTKFAKRGCPLKENYARFYISQLILAVEYLQYLDLIHRDIKPENIMMDALGYIKLTDFGQCIRCLENERVWTFCGTPCFMAPEVIRQCGYNCAVDWWSVGVTLFQFCAGRLPFFGKDKYELYESILSNNYVIPDFFSKRLTHLMQLFLADSQPRRIGKCKGANAIKAHPWFESLDWYAILNRTLPAPHIP